MQSLQGAGDGYGPLVISLIEQHAQSCGAFSRQLDCVFELESGLPQRRLSCGQFTQAEDAGKRVVELRLSLIQRALKFVMGQQRRVSCDSRFPSESLERAR